jgi:hypothetical protein
MYVVDCKSLYDDPSYEGRRRSGFHSIYVEGLGHRSVYCDMGEGGWTRVQERAYGDVNFTRGMDDYINGFGNVTGSHVTNVGYDCWIGLEMLHRLTNINGSTSSIKLLSSYDITGTFEVEYNVSVGDRDSGYMLHVGVSDKRPSDLKSWYSVRPIMGLRSGDGMRFSTVDHDLGSNCSAGIGGGGGWWYGRGPEGCSYLLINAIFGRQGYGGMSVDGGGSYVSYTNMYVKRN